MRVLTHVVLGLPYRYQQGCTGSIQQAQAQAQTQTQAQGQA